MTQKTKATPRHKCALCGKKLTVEHLIFSSFTRNRYCAAFDACNKRAKKRKS